MLGGAAADGADATGEEAADDARATGGKAASAGCALVAWGALREAEELVAGLGDEHGLDSADVELLRETGAREVARATALDLPLQPVHGDAHLRNLLASPAGPLWIDWEDSFIGPRGWDLACFYATLPPFDTQDPTHAAQAYRGYGEPLHVDLLRALVGARRFQMLALGRGLGARQRSGRARVVREPHGGAAEHAAPRTETRRQRVAGERERHVRKPLAATPSAKRPCRGVASPRRDST